MIHLQPFCRLVPTLAHLDSRPQFFYSSLELKEMADLESAQASWDYSSNPGRNQKTDFTAERETSRARALLLDAAASKWTWPLWLCISGDWLPFWCMSCRKEWGVLASYTCRYLEYGRAVKQKSFTPLWSSFPIRSTRFSPLSSSKVQVWRLSNFRSLANSRKVRPVLCPVPPVAKEQHQFVFLATPLLWLFFAWFGSAIGFQRAACFSRNSARMTCSRPPPKITAYFSLRPDSFLLYALKAFSK